MSTTTETEPTNEDPDQGAQSNTEQNPGTPTEQAESLLLEVEHKHTPDCSGIGCVDLHN